jgi:4-amino-4-deoxy-L-arabinose transferase-like glycosyltransferase
LRENFQRFTSVVDHKAPWWYHIAAMMGGYFPWSVFLPQAFLRAALPRPVIDPRSGHPVRPFLLRYGHLSGRDDVLLFAALFALVTLVFFSASVSKLLPYTLPAFPALALIVGVELERIIKERATARLLAPVAALAIIYGAAGLVAPAALGRLRDAPPDLLAIAHGYVSFMCLSVILALVAGLAGKRSACIVSLLALAFCGSSYFGLKAVSSVAKHWEEPLPGLAAYAAQSGWPIVVFDMRKPAVPFYAHKHVIQPPSEEALKTALRDLPHACIITKSKRQALFDSLPGSRTATREGQFMLVEWRATRE